MTEREKIAARIRALRAKTVENGCTEGEAMAAAVKLAQLLDDYNMTLDEAELRASPFTRHREAHEDDVGARLWIPAHAIAQLTGAANWTSSPGVHPVEQHFFGLAHEVEVARYLLEICAYAMRSEVESLRRRERPPTRARWWLISRPFLDGMADRLAERILALKPPRPTGTGLVALRSALIAEALAEAGIQIKRKTVETHTDRDPAYARGREAAESVALNPGLGGANSARQIAGR